MGINNPNNFPYFIAEIGLNHNGNIDLAKRLIDISISAGCSAVKFQKRQIGKMFPAVLLDQPFSRFPELGNTQREVRESFELSEAEYTTLRNYCRGKIDFIVTPFDLPSLEFLDTIDLDAYKIASHNAADIPLLKEISSRDKPIIVSVGMSTEREVDRLVQTLGKNDLILLHCVSSYPTLPEDANLHMINWLKKYGYTVGYSDHEDGILMAPIAVALGADVIEKHVTLDKNMPGFDHKMSIEPHQIVEVVRNIKSAKQATKITDTKEVLKQELDVFDNRRLSIYASRKINKGETITSEMIAVKAPLRGLTPHLSDRLIGAKALYDLDEDTPITFGVVKLK